MKEVIPEKIHHQDTKMERKTPRKDMGEKEERLAAQIVDAAIKVHRELGPGLLESVYEACLAHELVKRGIHVITQVAFPVIYEGLTHAKGLRVNLLVEDPIIVEIKAVETILPVHEAQLLTDLKLSRKRLGFLLNFNAPLMKNGIQRRVL